MKKSLKLYIDTSVWNFALEHDRQDSIIANEFIRLLKGDEYKVIVSNIVKAEIDEASEPRKSDLIRLLTLTNAEILKVTEEALNLAEVYLKEGLIAHRYFNDAVHIAIATVNRCNALVSWNFKHIVRARVIMEVHHLNHREGYGLIEIVSPRVFLGK